MRHLLHRASLRFYLRHPWQLALAIIGIGLGVAVYVGVGLANDGAARAFDVAAQQVRGTVTHRLLPLQGSIDEALYRDLVLRDHIPDAAPVLEVEVGIAMKPGLRARLLGIDPLQPGTLWLAKGMAGSTDFAGSLFDTATVLLPTSLATDLGVARGQLLTLTIDGRGVDVRVIGFVPDGVADDIDARIIADIATTQELTNTAGKLSHIDLTLDESQARAVTAQNIPGVVLVPTETENSAFRQLTAAFRTNLTALGLLALVVGMFLIYGTMTFAVLRRTTTIGILRALGVSRMEIMTTVATEALVIAVIATTIGLVLGHVLAIVLVRLVLQTIDDLSFGAAVGALAPSNWLYIQGAVLGIAATLLAAAKPVLDGTRIEPTAALRRAVLERRAHVAAHRAAVLALGLALGSSLLLLFGPSELAFSFGGLFGVLAAGALLTPLATVAFMRMLDAVVRRKLGIAVTLAIRGVSASLSRTGVATAALAIAVATVNGVGLMITSFRTSLDDWLSETLTADIYVSSGDQGAELAALVDSGALAGIDGVAAISRAQTRIVPTPQGDVAIRAFAPGSRGWGLAMVAGDPNDALAQLTNGQAVVASERLLFARGLEVGDVLEVPSPTGVQRLTIAGAYRDFNTGVPGITMSLERYRRDWRDRNLSGVGLHLTSDTESAAVETAARSLLGSRFTGRVRSSAAIERLSLAVFDRTFKVTEVLRILAGIVAFLGILSALLAIELERAHELSVLRTLGFTPGGLRATLLTQTGLLGLAAGLAAIPIGSALAALLVHVINRRSFGWSMDLVVGWVGVTSGIGLAVGAALLAGVYPAWRASRIELAAGLREE